MWNRNSPSDVVAPLHEVQQSKSHTRKAAARTLYPQMPWRCPTQVVFERGAIASRLPSLARALGATAALVSDPGLQATPWPAAVATALEAGGVKVVRPLLSSPFLFPLRRSSFDCVWTAGRVSPQVLSWSDVEANPRDTTVNRLGAAVKAAGAEFIVAVGGGSSIDAAKGAASACHKLGRCNADVLRALLTRALCASSCGDERWRHPAVRRTRKVHVRPDACAGRAHDLRHRQRSHVGVRCDAVRREAKDVHLRAAPLPKSRHRGR